jgi:uncharacterized protein YndB with AHSA1/START domain/uncharacterized protein YciI
MSTLPPLLRQVVVPAGPKIAFAVFTERIGAWWPVRQHSVHGEKSVAEFRDGRLVETAPDGTETEWGEVLDWDPPRRLRMTWHPGYAAARASLVEVSFAPVGESSTLVTVSHSDWERFAEPRAARDEYRNGWPGVLASFASAVSPSSSQDDEPVFIVLTHRPGPGVGNPFEHPLFRGHPAFLQLLQERGQLVAAGPFPGSGEGMAVVKLRGPGEVAGLLNSAYEEDASVTAGVLEVHARPWVVMMGAPSLG